MMTQSALPPEWLHIQLGDVVAYGKTRKCVLEDVTEDTWVLELEDIEKESSRVLSRKTAKERPFKSSKNHFEEGNVLYGKLRPYLNKVVVADEPGVCTTEIIPLDAEPQVYNRYLFYWLKTRDLLNYVNEVSYGVNMPRLGTQDGTAAPFILAPLAEQKVIADKLYALLAQVESIKARLDRIPQILKRFRQSVLAAAVSGRLTEEWRAAHPQPPTSLLLEKISKVRAANLQAEISEGSKESSKLLKKVQKHDPQLPEVKVPEDWQWTTFMSSMEKVVDCHNKTAPYTDTGVPLIRTPDIRDGEISLKNTKYVDNDTYKYWSRRCPPQQGDIIFTREAPMGEAGIVPEDVTLCMGQRMMLLRPLSQFVKAEYVLLNILSPSFQQRMFEKAVGTGVKHLRVADVESLTYPLAPLEEQTEIVRRVDQLFAYADRVEQQVNNALERVNNLTQSILAKAFRGELTEQWRRDNPELISGDNSAEALLERIKAERAAMKPAKRGRKKASA